MFKNGMRPIHPGEILLEDYIKPMGISVRALSIALNVPYSRLREIVDGKRGVSADTALRLQRYFGLAHLKRVRFDSKSEAFNSKQGKLFEELHEIEICLFEQEVKNLSQVYM